MEDNKKLLSGNEALALGAYHAGVRVAAAYPGTPSSEIMENVATYEGVYAEWSTNEKVAMEVAMGAAYSGVRALATMKHVGLNVAADAFMAASMTGVVGGLVVICADDPGIHSSQNEQDNRHYARLAKIPLLEPADSQEAYDLMPLAYDISERYDTPVMVRSTTRISHSQSVVSITGSRPADDRQAAFHYNVQKYVMLPVNALPRHGKVEERMAKLAEYTETFPGNRIMEGDRKLGVISSGVAYQYAREVFPDASFLKLAMTWPLPKKLIKKFAGMVDRVIVIEELDPFLQDNILAMGIPVTGKEFIPVVGELNTRVVEEAARRAGLLEGEPREFAAPAAGLPKRPPLLCPGCPHTGVYFTLNTLGQRGKLLEAQGPTEPEIVIAGDIGCYTLGAYPPLNVLDTTACMGAGIGQAQGIEKAGVRSKVVAVIGDSTFMHAGTASLISAVYNQSHITVVVLDNHTTAMTGHQEHPGTGLTIRGEPAQVVDIESVVRGIGVKDVKVIDAFDTKALRTGLRDSINKDEISVVIVRGACAVRVRTRTGQRVIDSDKCNRCGVCLRLGCPAIQDDNGRLYIDATLCAGDNCGLCEQLCPQKAISRGEATR